jgi:hypothetical protein
MVNPPQRSVSHYGFVGLCEAATGTVFAGYEPHYQHQHYWLPRQCMNIVQAGDPERCTHSTNNPLCADTAKERAENLDMIRRLGSLQGVCFRSTQTASRLPRCTPCMTEACIHRLSHQSCFTKTTRASSYHSQSGHGGAKPRALLS